MANPNPKVPSQLGKASNAKGTPWASALKKASSQYKCDGPGHANALRRIADNVVECALDKESPHFEFAIKELGARLDGTAKIEGGVNPTEFLHSISDAFTALVHFKSQSEALHGEVIVQDRPVLSSEVCVEAGGYGEGVDIQDVSGGAGEP